MSFVSVEIDLDDIIVRLSKSEKRELLAQLQKDLSVPRYDDDGLEWLSQLARGDFVDGLRLLRRSLSGAAADLADRALVHASHARVAA